MAKKKQEVQAPQKKRGVAVEPIAEPTVPIIGLTVAEAASALRVSPRAVQDMLAAGKMPGRLVAGKWRISAKGLDEFLSTYEHDERQDDKA